VQIYRERERKRKNIYSERAIAREELFSTGQLVEDQSPVLAPTPVMSAVPATYAAATVA